MSEKIEKALNRLMKLFNIEKNGEIFVCVAWDAVDTEIKCENSLCMEMFFVKGRDLADKWQQVDTEKREVFTLNESAEFAREFFVPLIS